MFFFHENMIICVINSAKKIWIILVKANLTTFMCIFINVTFQFKSNEWNYSIVRLLNIHW